MPFTYSITFGISIAIVTYTLLNAASGKLKEVHPMMWILTVIVIALQAGWINKLAEL